MSFEQSQFTNDRLNINDRQPDIQPQLNIAELQTGRQVMDSSRSNGSAEQYLGNVFQAFQSDLTNFANTAQQFLTDFTSAENGTASDSSQSTGASSSSASSDSNWGGQSLEQQLLASMNYMGMTGKSSSSSDAINSTSNNSAYGNYMYQNGNQNFNMTQFAS